MPFDFEKSRREGGGRMNRHELAEFSARLMMIETYEMLKKHQDKVCPACFICQLHDLLEQIIQSSHPDSNPDKN